ncbi:MAG: EamA family transporter [bacterium]|nr:EamA family transporter [bacterium]
MNKLAWGLFFVVGLIWGSSFLLIRVGVEAVPASQVVFTRTLIAAVGLNIALLVRGKRLPTDWPTMRALGIIGIGNSAIPYMLIAVGEQTVPSGLTAVLQATAALFTLMIAHFTLADERITARKVLGLALGFGGIVVLSSRQLGSGQSLNEGFLGMLSIMGGSLFYAIFTVYSKKLIRKDVEPLQVAAGSFISAAIGGAVLCLVEPLFPGGRSFVPYTDLSGDVLRPIVVLGVLNTFVAYLFFYYLIQQLGAFRASMVTYVVPPVGLFLGWLFLNERLDLLLLAGAALIFTGIAVVNIRLQNLRRKSVAAAPIEKPVAAEV